MADPRFFPKPVPMTAEEIAALTGAELADAAYRGRVIGDVAPLDRAGAGEVGFLDNPKYVEAFAASAAGAAFLRARYREKAPPGMALLLTEDPYRAYALLAQRFYPALRPAAGISPLAVIEAGAKLGKDCAVGPGAFVGAHAEIGDRCVIGPNAVIAAGVKIGDDTHIGALSSVSHAMIGDRVIVHRGAHIGQDGFGFSLGRGGHVKVPQLGRVLIEDDVEIGSGTCIDRGAGPDTVIGRGAKIDNLVQIGHNVRIGEHAVIVAQAGVSGSTQIGQGAVLAGQAGVAGHLHVGAGARIAAQAGVMRDVPPGASYGGSPAVPARDWHRQTVALASLTKRKE